MAGPHAEYEADVVGAHPHGDPMTGRHLHLSVVTPGGSILTHTVDEVTAPGAIGELGILPGHLPVLAALRAGVFSWRHGQKREILAVGPGYVQVGAGDQVRVIVQQAQTKAQIDVAAARRDLEEATAALKQDVQGAELALVQARIDWANARLAVAASA